MFNADKKKKSHLKNLINVALADGKLDVSESRIVISLAKELGLSKEEIEDVKRNPESIDFKPPKNYKDKVRQAHELVTIMLADKVAGPKELALCKNLALKLDLLPKIIDDIIDHVSGNPNPHIEAELS